MCSTRWCTRASRFQVTLSESRITRTTSFVEPSLDTNLDTSSCPTPDRTPENKRPKKAYHSKPRSRLRIGRLANITPFLFRWRLNPQRLGIRNLAGDGDDRRIFSPCKRHGWVEGTTGHLLIRHLFRRELLHCIVAERFRYAHARVVRGKIKQTERLRYKKKRMCAIIVSSERASSTSDPDSCRLERYSMHNAYARWEVPEWTTRRQGAWSW